MVKLGEWGSLAWEVPGLARAGGAWTHARATIVSCKSLKRQVVLLPFTGLSFVLALCPFQIYACIIIIIIIIIFIIYCPIQI